MAAEMEREDLDIPLMIGGATTSMIHTAVKISPGYNKGQAILVLNASRAVGVVGKLMSAEHKNEYIQGIRDEYVTVTDRYEKAEGAKERVPLANVRANAFKIDFDGYSVPAPQFTGTRVIDDWDLAEIAKYIDWIPFFRTWELNGVYLKILADEKQGEVARSLLADAQKMVAKIIEEKWFGPRAVVGFWPANAVDNDIRLYRRRSPASSDHLPNAAPAACHTSGSLQCRAV